jgi:hypothetical protein
MKVKELLDALTEADPEAEVILQKDAEDSGYSPLKGADLDAVYVPESTCSGDVYSMEWTSHVAGKTDAEWDEIQAKPRCVVLYPVN